MNMDCKRRTFIVACALATIASSRPSSRAAAFRAAAPSLIRSPLSSPSPSSSLAIVDHRGRDRTRLGTASKEFAEISNDELLDDNNDPWTLRQITFLGLTAADDDDDDDESLNRNSLDARNLSEFLMEIGACSVSVTDSDADTENEDPLFGEPTLTSSPCSDDDDEDDEKKWAMIIPDLAAGKNLWRRCDVSAHFPSSLDVSSIVDSVRHAFDCPSGPRYEVDDVPDRDWILHVQESWTPIATGESKFVLRFPWHDDGLVMKACQEAEMERMKEAMQRKFSSGVKREGAVVHFEDDDDDDVPTAETVKQNRDYVQIRLEGGIAFGTGEHPTTRLCLGWVRDNVERRLHDTDDGPLHFMDYGAGSGVLGIAAASVVRDHNARAKQLRRGKLSDAKKSITTVGVEIDVDAILIADENARNNDVDMSNYLPDTDSLDAEALSVVMRAMQRKSVRGAIRPLPDELNGPIYDMCAANILAGPLVGLAPTIASLVKSPGGEIGLSGILATKAESVVEAYDEFFEDVKVAGEENGWVLITGRRR